MEIQKTLKVTPSEFFKVLSTSVAADISSAKGESVNVKDVKSGTAYKKTLKNKMGSKSEVKVKIQEFNNQTYKASFQSTRGINTLCYQIAQEGENTLITYSEEFEASGAISKVNHKMMTKLYDKKSTKKVNILLDSMESYIIQNR